MSGGGKFHEYPSQVAVRVLANIFYGLRPEAGFPKHGGVNPCLSACRFHGYLTEFNELTDLGIHVLCKKAQLYARRNLERSPQETQNRTQGSC